MLRLLASFFFLYGCCAHGQKETPADQIAEWSLPADFGGAEAQYKLGDSYFFGRVVAQNYAEAFKWLRKAAEQGHAEAQASLGTCYGTGLGIPTDKPEKDYREAIKWYRKAAEQGLAVAQYNLGDSYAEGHGVKKDNAEAAKWYNKAAEQGFVIAQFNLGNSYYNGTGVKKNNAEAGKWWRKAAEQGLASAQYNLGACYASGQGVPKNDDEAVRWYCNAAEQGDAHAQCSLGAAYWNGEGVVKNEIEGYKWALLAAAKGDEIARRNALNDEGHLSPSQRAEGQRLAQEWEADHANHKDGKDVDRPTAEATRDTPKVTGTGFLITRNGYLATNYHVVRGSSKVRIQTASGLLDAEIIRVDAASDLALLKVAGAFDALPVVSSRTARLGAMVATVGFPNIGLQGFQPKLSKGEISSLAGIQDDVKQFQISIPVQPGNSGGALVDERGNVIGVVTAQLNQEAALASSGVLAQNVNYAVKSSYLLSFLEAVPEVGAGMIEAKNEDLKFEAVVDNVKKATVLILGY